MDGATNHATLAQPAGPHLPADLAQALAAGGLGLRLDLQPICAAANLAPVGYEALLRWDHPELGPTGALETLEAALAGGQAAALDAWVLASAFRLRATWPRGGPFLAVNLSQAAILSRQGAGLVRAALEATGADPRGISIELPEAAVERAPDTSRDLAADLRALGLSIALDDFGGTHGSARTLRDIPFAAVKIDPALTAGLEASGPAAERTRAMVAAVADMAHALGATVIGEAVETAEQMHALREAGCDALQGWLLGRPGQMD